MEFNSSRRSCVEADEAEGGFDLFDNSLKACHLFDPYTDFAKGTVGVRALQSIDIAVRHAESFAAMQDAIA